MNPNYVHTITLYHQDDGEWIRNVYEGCFFKAGIAVTLNGTQASQVNTYTVRIPKDVAGDCFEAAAGDMVILGECWDVINNEKGNRFAEVLNRNKPNAFKVTAVSDNTSHVLDKHYRLGG